MSHLNLKYLDAEHVLRPRIRQVWSLSDLRLHMVVAHGVSGANKSKGQLAREHMLAHAILSFPELRELIGVHPQWGKP